MPFSSSVRPSRHLFQLGATLFCTSLRKERRWWAIHGSAADQGGLIERERAVWHRLHELYHLDGRRDAGDCMNCTILMEEEMQEMSIDRKYLNTFRVDYATWNFFFVFWSPSLSKSHPYSVSLSWIASALVLSCTTSPTAQLLTCLAQYFMLAHPQLLA